MMTMATTPSRRRLDSSGEPLAAASSTTTTPKLDESPDSKKSSKPGRFLRRSMSRDLARCHQRIPYSQHVVDGFHRIPKRLRMFLLFTWILWKVTITLLFLRLVWTGATTASSAASFLHHSPWSHFSSAKEQQQVKSSLSVPTPQTRILYIVTSLAEYNNGRRQTVRGQDRLGQVLLPVLANSVESLVSHNYKVDVYLILGYRLLPERRQMIVDRLPSNVGLEVWDDATPLAYLEDASKKSKTVLGFNTRALARQHRLVVKDKLQQYDVFMNWEDDMHITGMHVQHFLAMSTELQRLYDEAPANDSGKEQQHNDVKEDPKRSSFFGPMSRRKMKRLIPGFVRVEVLLDDNGKATQALDSQQSPLPLDYDFEAKLGGGKGDGGGRHFDPSICCNVSVHEHSSNSDRTNARSKIPSVGDVVIWETNVTALSLRQMQGESSMLDWVVLLPGPGKGLSAADKISGYWSGRDGAFGDQPKPSPGEPRLVAQQGGWMATREQIMHLHTELCQGSFLPPFDAPYHAGDGHIRKNVEFWSGGYQFFTGVRGGCNMQRLISFHPDHFSKHFIYHVANNKQKQLSANRLVRAEDLFGQLNSIRKAAERTKSKATQ